MKKARPPRVYKDKVGYFIKLNGKKVRIRLKDRHGSRLSGLRRSTARADKSIVKLVLKYFLTRRKSKPKSKKKAMSLDDLEKINRQQSSSIIADNIMKKKYVRYKELADEKEKLKEKEAELKVKEQKAANDQRMIETKLNEIKAIAAAPRRAIMPPPRPINFLGRRLTFKQLEGEAKRVLQEQKTLQDEKRALQEDKTRLNHEVNQARLKIADEKKNVQGYLRQAYKERFKQPVGDVRQYATRMRLDEEERKAPKQAITKKLLETLGDHQISELLKIEDPQEFAKESLRQLETSVDRKHAQQNEPAREDVLEGSFLQDQLGQGRLTDGTRTRVQPLSLSKGLSNHEINDMMKKHKWFMGVIASDEIGNITPTKSAFGFIMNLDTSKGAGTHWVSVWIDSNKDRVIEYYDPFGEEPLKSFEPQINKLLQKIKPTTYLKYKVNMIQNQSFNSSNCGWFSVMYLLQRAKGSRFKFCSGARDLKEDEVAKLKKKYKFGYI